MESSFKRKVIPIELGDVVRMEKQLMDLFMVSKGIGDEVFLTDLSSGEILEFGVYSIQCLVEIAELTLICKNEDLYITNKQ